jgi:DNA gyrase subunit A
MPCYVLLPGVRLVVEVKRGFSPELVLNQLYKNTRLQLRFASNMVSLGMM